MPKYLIEWTSRLEVIADYPHPHLQKMVSSWWNCQHYSNEAAIRYHTYISIWRSEDQNQPKATSIAFCGSSEIIAPRLSCSVLIFLLKLGLEPLLFLLALQDHAIISKNMRRDIYRLPVVWCLACCIQDNFECQNKINMLIWEKLLRTRTSIRRINSQAQKAASPQLQHIWTLISSKPARKIDQWVKRSKQLRMYSWNWFVFPLILALSRDFFVSERTTLSHFMIISILEGFFCFPVWFFQNNLQSCQNE